MFRRSNAAEDLQDLGESAQKVARKVAKQALKEGRGYLKDGRNYLDAKSRIAYQVGKKMRKKYPALVHDARDVASTKAHEWSESLREAGHDALGFTSKMYHRGVRSTEFQVAKLALVYAGLKWLSRNPRLHEAGEKVKERVKAEPVESAVIALAVGFLVGRILG